MRDIARVPNSFSPSYSRKKKEGHSFESNIQYIRRLCLLAHKSEALSGVERIQLECSCTDAVMDLLSYLNSCVLKSFRYHLQIEESPEYLLKQGLHLQLDELQ